MTGNRKVYSQRSIPFSWEHKPGISKITLKQNPLDSNLQALDLTCASNFYSSSSSSSLPSQSMKDSHQVLAPKSHIESGKVSSATFEDQDKTLPLPPCRLHNQYDSLRSSSEKVNINSRSWQQDPFVMAYEECTKSNVKRDYELGFEGKKSHAVVINGFKVIMKCKSLFSCKNSCDVRELPKLPLFSKDKIKRLIR